jgi:exonuclease SbcC
VRFQLVSAHGFGPLHGETLELAEGLTVVFGPNESAKSSWHAATLTSLCGVPSGRLTSEWARFKDRHEPWDGGVWLVEARLQLDDGRKVRLRQNLGNRADRQATDLISGADVAGEINHDGGLDGARWLGLDRESFRATACVAQADILKVREASAGIQTFLQQAARDAGTGSPIDAITRLRAFADKKVGTERAPTKPLARARREVKEAQEKQEEALRQHTVYESRLAELRRLREHAARAQRDLRREEWAAAVAAAADLRSRTDEATTLSRQLAELDADSPPADSALRGAVDEALFEWRRIQPRNEPARTSGQLVTGIGGLDDNEFWQLVSDLETRIPDHDLVQEPATTARAERRRGRRLAAVSGSLAALGLAGLATGGVLALRNALVVAGAVAALLGTLVVLIGLVVGLRRWRIVARVAAFEAAEAAATANAGALKVALATRQDAMNRCAEVGLPADPAALRALALERERRFAVVGHQRAENAEMEQRAGTAVLAAAALVGVELSIPAEAAWSLEQWNASQAVAAERRENAHELRRQIASRLGGLDAAELEGRLATADASLAQAHSDLLDAGESQKALDQFLSERPVDSDEARLVALRAAVSSAESAVASATAALASAVPTLSITEAEEEVDRGKTEQDRVVELDETIQLTLEFMERAQERAYRTIAPRLKDAIEDALPGITGGRYVEATVDPESLDVKVWGNGGAPRQAHLLSFGTAEQIYLLLRIALAEHLVTNDRSCPLILDDVTVHADSQRTLCILELLLAASERRQIIVFTQQEQVREWARQRLTDRPHALRELLPVATV